MDITLAVQVVTVAYNYLELKRDIMKRRKRQRRWWSKPLIRLNYLTGYGGYTSVFKYFRLQDEEQFINFCRMNVQTFEYIFNIVRCRLTKISIRIPLPPELRLSLTLNYLAHGDSLRKNEWFFNIGLSTVKQVIPEVCKVLFEELRPRFLQFPSVRQLEAIALGFWNMWQFPNCIGAVDGRHCAIKKPPNSGSLFYNYKKFNSILLMAACDYEKRFTWVNVGNYGSLNDSGTFANSDLGEALSRNEINLPDPISLPNTNTVTPHVFIGDGGFPLKPYLMRPYIRCDQLSIEQRVFNLRLSHARMIVESAFGQLTEIWRVHRKELPWNLQTNEFIILASVCLHNLLIDFKLGEVEQRWTPLDENIQNFALNQRNLMTGQQIQNILSEYFVSQHGSVPWQWEKL